VSATGRRRLKGLEHFRDLHLDGAWVVYTLD